jgi:hypothetical protein
MKTKKTVRITLELPPEFMNSFHASQQLKHLNPGERRMTASDVLARLAYLEAMGAPPEQIAAEMPMEWRPEGWEPIAIHAERRVYVGKEQISGPTVALRTTYGAPNLVTDISFVQPGDMLVSAFDGRRKHIVRIVEPGFRDEMTAKCKDGQQISANYIEGGEWLLRKKL